MITMLSRYAVDKEDKESFPPERLRYTSLDAWTYKTAEQLGSSSLSHWGLLALYSGGGYTQVCSRCHIINNICIGRRPLLTFVSIYCC